MTQQDVWGKTDTDTEPDWGTPDSSEDEWGQDTSESSNDWGTDETPAWSNSAAAPEQASEWDSAEDGATEWDAANSSDSEWESLVSGQPTEAMPVTDRPDSGAAQNDGPAWSQAAPAADDQVFSSGWDEDGDPYEDSSTQNYPGSPKPASKVKPLIIIAVAVLAVLGIAGAILGFTFLGGSGDGEQEPPPETTQTEETLAPELVQLQPFAEAMGEALTNRDPEAYYDLYSEESKSNHDLESVETALEALPAGASYEMTVVGGSVAGPTATLRVSMDRTYDGETSSSSRKMELVKEGDDWKLVVAADNSN